MFISLDRQEAIEFAAQLRDPSAFDGDGFGGCASDSTGLHKNCAPSWPRCVLKIVVFDDPDYRYAQAVAARYPGLPVYLQVGNPAPSAGAAGVLPAEADIDDLLQRLRWLVGKVTADRWFAATVLPQLHVLAWGNKRGV